MYSKSQKMKTTGVKIIFTVFSLLFTQVSFGEDSKSSSSDVLAAILAGKSDSVQSLCRQYQDKYDSSMRDLSRTCKDAGAGSNCVSKVQSCSQDASEDGGINLAQTAATAVGTDNALGTALGIMGQAKGAGGGCPQYSFQDYFSKKKEYQDDLDQTEEDLAKLSDDKAEIQADFNKKISDLQEDLNKAQEDLEKTKDQISKDKLENTQKLQEAQNAAKDSMRSQATTLLDLHGKLITSQRDKSLNMIALTEASAKRACMKTVNEMKTQWQKEGVLSGFSSGTMIAKAKRLKQDLIDTWNDCMTVYDQKKQALLESKKQEEDMLRKQIQDTTESMAQTKDSMDSAEANMAQMNALADKQLTQAETNMKNTQTAIQTKMTAAKQELEQKLATLATKTTNYSQKINRLNTQINSLGVAPASGATSTPSQASGELNSNMESVRDAYDRAEELRDPNNDKWRCKVTKNKPEFLDSLGGVN